LNRTNPARAAAAELFQPRTAVPGLVASGRREGEQLILGLAILIPIASRKLKKYCFVIVIFLYVVKLLDCSVPVVIVIVNSD
jgi:hypothetical protein